MMEFHLEIILEFPRHKIKLKPDALIPNLLGNCLPRIIIL